MCGCDWFAAEDEAAAGSDGDGEGAGDFEERDWATSGARTRGLDGVFSLGG